MSPTVPGTRGHRWVHGIVALVLILGLALADTFGTMDYNSYRGQQLILFLLCCPHRDCVLVRSFSVPHFLLPSVADFATRDRPILLDRDVQEGLGDQPQVATGEFGY